MTHTVLVVEDEKDLADTLRDVLSDEGFDVVTARDGREALAAIPAIEHLCLIFLDLLMPGMNGWDFFDALKRDAQLAAVPVVITSSAAARAPAGATRVMTKPLDLDRILHAARELCTAA